ncbi:MAG: hypothetical protein JWN03_5498 [Nocardia sp.]|uniref:hypothetical protein n=1 Tax=Nocardia sp. TaxID=1821 RepID=UPI00261B43AD|nr:hypothetical protein [Nocardia sp.]MCU1645223.1 hypothetical protein [Nocardia sp.]
MIRLRLRRRWLAIGAAVTLAAAALVAVSMPATAESQDASTVVSGDYLRHTSNTLVCAGPVAAAPEQLLVA